MALIEDPNSPPPPSVQMNPVEWGRLLERLDNIRVEIHELKERHVFRLDNIEGRVEVLERASERASIPRLADKLAEKVVWSTLGFVGALLVTKLLGIV